MRAPAATPGALRKADTRVRWHPVMGMHAEISEAFMSAGTLLCGRSSRNLNDSREEIYPD
jgi:hypothetical protein